MALPRCGCHSACVAAGAQEGKGEEGEAEARPPPLPETVRCLAGAWARASAATAAAHGAALVARAGPQPGCGPMARLRSGVAVPCTDARRAAQMPGASVPAVVPHLARA